MTKKNTSLARNQANKLLAEVTSGIEGIREVDLNIDTLLENAGIGRGVLGDDVSSADMLEDLRSKNKFIRSTISLIKQLKKNKADLDALTKPEIRAVTQTGRGPSLAYAINTQLGINRRRLRAGDIMTVAEQRAQEFVGPIASQEQIEYGLRADKERRRNHYNYLRKQVSERRAERKERKENHYNYLRKQAGERRDLYDKAPWAKSLIKSGIIDQKYIPNISKKIDRMVRLPLVGYGLRMAVRNPALGAYMLAATYLNKSVSSDQSMTSMKVGQKAFGPIPQQFRIFAAATGMKEEQTQKAWFGLQEKYGPAAISILSIASKAMEGKTPLQRQYIAQGFGIDANLVRIADMMTGTRAMDKGERTTLAKHFTEIQKEFGFSSDADAKDLLASLYLTIPGMSSARAKDAGASDWVFDEILEGNARINEILSGVSASQNAAISAVGYDSQSSASNITTNNTSGDITINQVIYASGNAQEIAEKVGDETQEAINRQRVMDAITTGDKQ